jgi:anaerobic magnesium-protoporphyrin IX monomethyl ester cyclase
MKKNTVIFIAGTEYDNLGIGYMCSTLAETGIETKIIDFQKKNADILNIIKRNDPSLIGFSIYFLNYIEKFRELGKYLRSEGIKCHFTAGGHYASLKPEEVFNFMPWLDSIVRFEGEYTLPELVKCIISGTDWKQTDSLAYIENGQIILNPLRPLEKDLDKFPFPKRSPLKNFAFNKTFSTIIAGRGCIYECSFCNCRKFYSLPAGPVKRIRKPENVVKEMEYLFNFHQCSVFLFQDDDFPVKSKLQPCWLEVFCKELERVGLSEKVIWKINCRPDEIDEKNLSLMKKHGLFNIFLGIEDGTDTGLKILNKHLTVQRTLKAIGIIKKSGIGFEYGFILFQPLTTFRSLNENIDFLISICGDGYSPVPFQKLIPLYETRVEKELLESGRLKVSEFEKDYDFPEEAMNHYYDFVFSSFYEWIRGVEGVENLSKWTRNYFSVYFHYFDVTPEGRKIYREVKKVISESNMFLLETMKNLATIYETKQYIDNKTQVPEGYRQKIKSKHQYFRNKIIITMGKLVSLVEAQQVSADS